MAVTTEFGKIVYGGVDSSTYGIYISGEGAYNAPERAVELVDVPGRNGAIVLDQGRYENIEITYPAGVFGDDPTQFASKLSAFRNAILSQQGYQRLEDSYNPSEYRMGMYISGVEVSPVAGNLAGEFDLTFNCKPQRFLTSGETKTTVANGGTISNPTKFDSFPLIEAYGSGTISFNGYDISLNNGKLGYVVFGTNVALPFQIDESCLNLGDSRTLGDGTVTLVLRDDNGNIFNGISNVSGSLPASVSYSGDTVIIHADLAGFTTASSDFTGGHVLFQTSQEDGGRTDVDVTIIYHLRSNGLVELTYSWNAVMVAGYPGVLPDFVEQSCRGIASIISAVSTAAVLGSPTYIDCETGFAYRYINNTLFPLNKYIDLGSDLPRLKSGTNEITFSNTFTKVDVMGRWWKI